MEKWRIGTRHSLQTLFRRVLEIGCMWDLILSFAHSSVFFTTKIYEKGLIYLSQFSRFMTVRSGSVTDLLSAWTCLKMSTNALYRTGINFDKTSIACFDSFNGPKRVDGMDGSISPHHHQSAYSTNHVILSWSPMTMTHASGLLTTR